jgi:hypothetical protein
MRSKSWLVILIMGIVGFCALGFITKFAMDSNPSLLRIAKLKQAIAQDFSSKAVGEVGVRPLPDHRGFILRIETPRAMHPDPPVFCREVVECFLRRFDGPRPPFLKPTLVEPGMLGCAGSKVYFEKEISTDEVVNQLELVNAVNRVVESCPPAAAVKARPVKLEDPLRLTLEAAEPRQSGELESLFSHLKRRAAEELSAGRGRTVILQVWSRGPAGKLLKEERLEPPNSPRRLPPVPAPVPDAGPGPAPQHPGN